MQIDSVRKLCLLLIGLAGFTVQMFGLYASGNDDAALDEYYAATGLYNENMFDLAANEYKSFIAKYPNHPKILNAKLGLGLSLYALKKYRDAGIIFAGLADESSSPHKEQVHNLLGQCYLIEGKPVLAEAAFRWSVNRGKEKFFMELPGVGQNTEEIPGIQVPTDIEPLERSYAGLVEALYRQNKWEDVSKFADELKKLSPEGKFTSRARFLGVLGKYRLKEYDKTAAEIASIIKKEPNFPYKDQAYVILADCQQNMGKINEAIKNNEIVAHKLQGQLAPEALFRMGFLKFMNKEYRSAIQDFDELRKKYPDNEHIEEAGIYLGKSYLELKKYKEAQAVFGKMVDKGSKRAEATLWLAETFVRREDYKTSSDILKSALSTFKKDKLLGDLTFKYANALMGLEKYKEAAVYFKKTAVDFSDSPLSPDALRLESLCENKAGRYGVSFEVCSEFLKKYPHDPYAEDVAFLKADNLFFLKKYDDAIKAYRQFIPWDGTGKYTDFAIFRIVQSLCELKRWDEAISETKPLLSHKVKGSFFEQLDYMIGLANYNLENWNPAIRNFDKFVKEYPNVENADSALMKKASAYLILKMPKEAEVAFLRVLKAYPDSEFQAQALVETGKIYFERKDYAKASELFKKVTSKYDSSPFIPQAEYYLAWISLEQENSDKAMELFQSVAERFSDTPFAPDALYQQGILLLKQKHYKLAKEKFDKFIEKYGANSKIELVRFYQAVAISKGGTNGKAEEMFKKFIADHPKSNLIPRALYESAWLARERKKINQARDDYKALISEFPTSKLAERATFELAELEYEEKNYDASLALLDKLLSKSVSDDLQQKILYREAWCFLGRKQEDDALETFERLLKNWPNTEFTPVAAYQAGELRLKRKDFMNAYELFKQSVMAGGEGEVREQALLRLGEAQTLRNNWSGAKKTFETFMAEFPKSSFMRRSRFWRGWCNENLKAYKNAITDYNAVLRYNIKDDISARAQFQLGETYMELKEYDSAIKELVKVEINYGKFEQWVVRAKLEMGQILDKQGKKDLAIEQYRKLIKRYPKTDEANLARELLLQHQVYIDK